jgi:single-strand DNA-binding protein
MALLQAFGEMRVVGDPVLRFTPDGVPVCNVRLVCNARRKDAQGGWEDDPKKVLWANATIWRKPAENLVNSIRDKDLVHVVGTFYEREYEHNGVKGKSIEIDATSISPSLTFRTTPHSDQQPAQGQPQGQPPQGQPQGYAQGQGNNPNNPWGPAQGPAQGQPAYAQQGGPQQGWNDPYQQPPFL